MNIVVGGYGCICAAGKNIAELEASLFGARSVEPSLPLGRMESAYAAEYPVFQVDRSLFPSQRDSESLSLLFIRTAIDEALSQAELTADSFSGLRVGVCVGSSVEASFVPLEFFREIRKGSNIPNEPFRRFVEEAISDSVLACYGLTGISQTVVTACASGTDAIGIGAEWLENDLCDVVIAGGTDELNIIPYIGFIRLMIAGKTPCKPFAKGRQGITLGEGAGAVVLMSPPIAKRLGVTPQGWVLGYGNACDGYHATAPEPTGRGLRKAIGGALTQSGMTASELAFVNAHGTGTVDNDSAEAAVFHSLLKEVPVCATKSYTGHTLAAAGAMEAAITLLSLNRGEIPKVNFFDEPDERLALVPVLETQKIPSGKYAALSNSLAFGGCNSALILGGKEHNHGF